MQPPFGRERCDDPHILPAGTCVSIHLRPMRRGDGVARVDVRTVTDPPPASRCSPRASRGAGLPCEAADGGRTAAMELRPGAAPDHERELRHPLRDHPHGRLDARPRPRARGDRAARQRRASPRTRPTSSCVEDGGRRLVLRAASEPYAHAVGRVSMRRGRGASRAGCSRTASRSFIPDNALADPRIKYFPELEEEKYQSIVSVPADRQGRRGHRRDRAARRGAARVQRGRRGLRHPHRLARGQRDRERAPVRAHAPRVRELERLSRARTTISRAELARRAAAATVEQALTLLARPTAARLPARADRRPAAAARLGADRGGRAVDTRLAARARQRAAPQPRRSGAASTSLLASALWGGPASTRPLVAPLSADDEVLGFLVARAGRAAARAHDDDRDLATSIAGQTAVGLKSLQLIEGLAERNLIKDFFDDLIAGRRRRASRRARAGSAPRPRRSRSSRWWCLPRARGGRAAATRSARPGRRGASRARCGRALPGVLVDRRDEDRCARSCPRSAATRCRRCAGCSGAARGSARRCARVGVSSPCGGPAALATGFAEAQQAARARCRSWREPRGALRFDDARPVQVPAARAARRPRARPPRARRCAACSTTTGARQAQLLRTLEEFLRQRGNISATAQALYVHPNTLRQRLRRIADLTGLDVRTDDWLMIEIACKLLKLEEVYPPGDRPRRLAGPDSAIPAHDHSYRSHDGRGRAQMATVSGRAARPGSIGSSSSPTGSSTDEQKRAPRAADRDLREGDPAPRAATTTRT